MATQETRTKVVILTGTYRIKGYIDLVPGARVTDFMVQAKDFIALTDAEVWELEGRQVFTAPFINVSREHIEVVRARELSVSGAATEKPACQVCGRTTALRRAIVVRPAVASLIQEEVKHWDEGGWICLEDLQRFQHKYVEHLLEDEKGELTQLEQRVLESLRNQEILSQNPETEFEAGLTLGQRAADRIATFGGSWVFIAIFALVMLSWMLLNSYVLAARPFDPYPYILLNLVLSCLAAVQAPVIMMSQNRQEARDRQRSMHDYQVNLKAELEIRHLHQKIDHLLSRQWERLVEIQEVQMELINQISHRKA